MGFISCKRPYKRLFLSLILTGAPSWAFSAPAACFALAQKTSFAHLSDQDSRFASCSSDKAKPQRGARAQGISAETLSLSLSQITSCLDSENKMGLEKKLIPLMTGESGFFSNAFGADHELGVGQLMPAAVQDVEAELIQVRSRFLNSDDPVCKTWAQDTALWKPIQQGCELMYSVTGTRKNLLYSALYFQLLYRWNENFLLNRKASEKIRLLGLTPTTKDQANVPSWQLPENQYHFQDLVGVLTAVAYNVGSKGLVQYLLEYLELRAPSVVSKNDFNFKEDLSYLNKKNSSELFKIPVSDLSFPAFLKIYQRGGHPGYGPDMMKKIYHYNEKVGPHLCTPERIEGFLAL